MVELEVFDILIPDVSAWTILDMAGGSQVRAISVYICLTNPLMLEIKI